MRCLQRSRDRTVICEHLFCKISQLSSCQGQCQLYALHNLLTGIRILHNQLKTFLQHGWGDLLGFPGLRQIPKHLKILCMEPACHSSYAERQYCTCLFCRLTSCYSCQVFLHLMQSGLVLLLFLIEARLERALGSLIQWVACLGRGCGTR